MKFLISISAIILSLSVRVPAQDDFGVSEVIWGPGPECASVNSNVTASARPSCFWVQSDQNIFFIASLKGISVAISYVFSPVYIRAKVQVTNHSGNAEDFDPAKSQIDVFSSRSAFLKGEKNSGVSANMGADDAKALYDSYRASLKTYPPTLGVGAMAPPDDLKARTKEKSYSSLNGRTNTIKKGVQIPPDLPKKPSDQNRSSPPNDPQPVQTSPTSIYDQVIQPSILSDQQKTAGYMFFELVKEPKSFLVFRIKVGNLIFVFPEEADINRKKPRK